jgi:uncharacterized protein (TIRG00374 family)
LVASLAILLTLVRVAGFREVGEIWRSVRPAGVLLSVACYFASIAVRILSWRRLLGEGAPSVRGLTPPLALGFVLGHVTPAKSGEPASALLVSRAFGIPLSRTLSVLTAERAIQLLVLLATFVPAAAFTAGRVLELRGAVRGAAALLVVLAAATLFAAPLLRRTRPAAQRIPRFGPVLGEYLEALEVLLSDRARVIPLLALGTLFWTLQYLSLWAILDAGGTSVNPIGAAAVAGAAILGGTLTLLPLGTQDGISAVVLAGLGVPMRRGFSLALFHTVLSLACGAGLALVAPLAMRRER